MIIGVIGAGHMGLGMGGIWAEHGHHVCFSYSRRPGELAAVVAAAGHNASQCTPAGAAQFGQVVLLAIHWPQVPEVVGELQPYLEGKPFLTCVLPWNSDRSGLAIGRDSSAAEQISRLAPGALVVEALPLLADWLYTPARELGSERVTLFYCGNDQLAKDTVAPLLEELRAQPFDAGDLTSARYLEPAAALLWHLAVGKGEGTGIALKLLRIDADEALAVRPRGRLLRERVHRHGIHGRAEHAAAIASEHHVR